jgi:hypothetical protein
LPNRDGGSCHPGQPCNLVRKREVGEAFLTLWADNCPMQPSVRSVAQEAGVGWNHASKVIEELLDAGDLVNPELTRPNQMDSGHFVGVGSRALKLEEEVLLLALRTEKPNRPNLDCIREPDRRHRTKVSSPLINQAIFENQISSHSTSSRPRTSCAALIFATSLTSSLTRASSTFHMKNTPSTRMPWHLKSVLIQQQDSWIPCQ